MKNNSVCNASDDDSMVSEDCKIKLRCFILVVNTADFINERTTPTLGPGHALAAPTAIFLTYTFLGAFVLGALRDKYPSFLLQVYGIVSCCIMECVLASVVFGNLKELGLTNKQAGLVLDGLLPTMILLLLIADLAVFLMMSREEVVVVEVVMSATNSIASSEEQSRRPSGS